MNSLTTFHSRSVIHTRTGTTDLIDLADFPWRPTGRCSAKGISNAVTHAVFTAALRTGKTEFPFGPARFEVHAPHFPVHGRTVSGAARHIFRTDFTGAQALGPGGRTDIFRALMGTTVHRGVARVRNDSTKAVSGAEAIVTEKCAAIRGKPAQGAFCQAGAPCANPAFVRHQTALPLATVFALPAGVPGVRTHCIVGLVLVVGVVDRVSAVRFVCNGLHDPGLTGHKCRCTGEQEKSLFQPIQTRKIHVVLRARHPVSGLKVHRRAIMVHPFFGVFLSWHPPSIPRSRLPWPVRPLDLQFILCSVIVQ